MTETNPPERKKPQAVDLGKSKQKPKVTKEENNLDFQIVANAIIGAINQEKSVLPHFPTFPHMWCVVELSKGVRQAYEVAKNGLVPISEKYACGEILSFAHKNFRGIKEFQIKTRSAQEIYLQWIVRTELTKPKLFSFSDEFDVISHVKLPWVSDLDISKPTPLFDEIFSRMTNGVALQEFLGSIFFEDSYSQQYVWIHGEGGDGKGSLLRAIQKVMGELYSPKFPKEEGDKFWEYSLIGKRLVGFPEIEDGNFVTTGIFKMLTGGDQIFINPKSKDPYSYTPFAKYIFLSNKKPNIALDRSDKRRLIYVTVKGVGGEPDSVEAASYEEKLQGESGVFLHRCIHKFLETRIHRNEPIKCDFSEYELLAEQNQEEFLVIADTYLEFAEHYIMPPHALMSLMRDVRFRDNRKVGAFRNFLEKRFKVTKKAVRDHGHIKYVYLGCRRRVFETAKVGYNSSLKC